MMFNTSYIHAQYCSSSSSNALFGSTSNVSIGTLNNNSFGCANYSDFTSIYTELLIDNTYTLNIGLQNCSNFSVPKVANVYIDWNANEIFEPSENVFHIDATSAALANQINFDTLLTVPANAVPDTVLMRVVTIWSIDDDLSDYSCGTYDYGETEDYSIIIKGLISDVNVQQNACHGDSIGEISIITSSANSLLHSIDGGITYSPSNVFTDLPDGVYDICVLDVSDNSTQCYVNNPVVISSPDPLFVSVNVTNLSCFEANDGQLDAQAFNGAPNYNFEWISDGINFSGSSLTNLSSGFYNLNVNDQNGCVFSIDSILVDAPDKFSLDSLFIASYAGYNVSCNSYNDGYFNVFVSGGVESYSYNLNGNISSISSHQNLSAGSYNLTVYDANFCSLDTSFVLNEPAPISSANTILHLGCENNNDGSLTTNIIGGVAPHSIQVTGTTASYVEANSAGISLFDSLQVDNYIIEVFDLNNCSYVDSFSIENPKLSLEIENVSCFGGTDGQINYSIDFSSDVFNVISPSSITSLSAGTYNFLIANDQGCYFDSTIVIAETEKLLVSESVSIICDDSELADIVIGPSGGVRPYSILWNNGDTLFKPSFGQGLYQYQCVDSNGCYVEGTIEVLPPRIPILNYSLVPLSCSENFDASIEVFVDMGYPPFIFEWDDGRNKAFIDSLPPNTYRLTVIDSANCQSTKLEVVVPYVYNDCFHFPSAFTPNDDGINDVYEVVSIFNRNPIQLSIYNTLGALVYQSSELKWDGTYKGTKCPQGRYYYLLNYSNQYTKGELWLLE